jgi:cytoskeletal protein CcmA (bactofilin family)
MFNREKTNGSPEKLSNNATLISEGTVLQGDVKSNHDLRIDGTIHGNVYCTSKIVVGPTGSIEGNIEGRQADITGKVTGNITVSELLQLRSESNVQGDIAAETLQVDPSAIFNGKCKMGKGVNGNIVLMNNNDEQKVALP